MLREIVKNLEQSTEQDSTKPIERIGRRAYSSNCRIFPCSSSGSSTKSRPCMQLSTVSRRSAQCILSVAVAAEPGCLIVSGFTQSEARSEYLDRSNKFGYHCTPTFTRRYGNQAIQKLAEIPQSLLDGTPDHYNTNMSKTPSIN